MFYVMVRVYVDHIRDASNTIAGRSPEYSTCSKMVTLGCIATISLLLTLLGSLERAVSTFGIIYTTERPVARIPDERMLNAGLNPQGRYGQAQCLRWLCRGGKLITLRVEEFYTVAKHAYE